MKDFYEIFKIGADADLASRQVCKPAEAAMEEGDFDGAIKTLEKMLKTKDSNDYMYYLLGIACMNAGKYAKAVKALDFLRQSYPDDIGILKMHAEACIENRNYKKAIDSAEKVYKTDESDYSMIRCLAEAYEQMAVYKKAEAVLKKALDNPVLKEMHFNICTRLCQIYFSKREFKENLEYMEKLLQLDAGEEEKIRTGERLLRTLDFFIDYRMYEEASRCTAVVIGLLPDRPDIMEYKKYVDKILSLDPEFIRFEKDGSVPDGLMALMVSELFPGEATGMTKEEKQAYTVMNEYQILMDFGNYLMPLRYIKNEYPGLYELKKEFFDSLQDQKKRKILKTKYQMQINKYRYIFEEMMRKWEEEFKK